MAWHPCARTREAVYDKLKSKLGLPAAACVHTKKQRKKMGENIEEIRKQWMAHGGWCDRESDKVEREGFVCFCHN